MFVYLSDILIFFPESETYVHYIRAILQRLLENQFNCKAEKWEFHTTKAMFLGHVITPRSVQMDSAKVQALLD